MAIDNKKFIKGISIKESADQSKQLEINVNSTSYTNTKTTLQSSQTANRTVVLPDASDTLATVTQVNAVQTNLTSHLNDSVDAHDASAVSNVPSGNLIATDVQSALNELQGDIDTGATNLTNHLNDTADAHDASAISNVPQGALASTNVQDALNELQGDITSSGGTLSSHISSTSVHGIVGNVVGDSDSQTLSNKTLSSPVINTPSGLVKGDVGLGNVDNTSDTTKNSASGTLTNKTIVVSDNTITTAASGNLTSTELNAALNELQLDINTRIGPSGLTSQLNANGYKITNIAEPFDASDAASKAYVDSVAAGLDPKASVRCATTADLGATYTTSPSNGKFTSGPSSIDSVTLSFGDRVLVKNQIDTKQNGIYYYSAAGEFLRAGDFDGSPDAEVSGGAFVFVIEGSTHAATGFVLLGSGTLFLNTNNLVFSQIAGAAGNSANNTLSNLGSTSINSDLLPDSTANNRKLGSSSKVFNSAYVSTVVAGAINDSSNLASINSTSRILYDNTGAAQNFSYATYPKVLAEKSQLSVGASSAPSGVEKDLYYNTTDKKYYFHNGTAWTELGSGGGATSTITAVAGENISINEALYLSQGAADGGRTTGRAYKLDASNDTRVEFVGFATAAATSGNNVTIQVSGPMSGFSSLSTGLPVYASVTTPGALQASAPNVSGQWIINLGIASGATALVINSGASSSAIKIGSDVESTSYALYPNKVTNPGAELNSTIGYSLYNDAAATPVDLTGGTPAGTLSVSSSSPLSGTNSFVYTPATAVGNGFAYSFTVDQAEKGKVLSITFDYIANSSYVDNDLAVWIYAVDGTTGLIQPANYLIKKSTISASMSCTFQTNIDTTSYRVGFHQTTTNNAYTFKLDNLMISRNRVTTGSVVTDWQSYTPTGGFTTNTSYTGKWRRVGDSMEVSYQMSFTGAPNAVNATINLPSNYAIDTSKMTAADSASNILGMGIVNTSSSQTDCVLRYASSNSLLMVILNASNSNVTETAPVTSTNPYTIANGSYIAGSFKVPIVGWSSNVVMSDQADTRVVAGSFKLSASPTITNGVNTAVSYDTTEKDTHGTFSGSIYTAPVSGMYRVSASAGFAANATNGRELHVYKNGSHLRYLDYVYGPSAVGLCALKGSTTLELKTGDNVQIIVSQNSGSNLTLAGGTSLNYFSIERLSGPATIAASEAIICSYSDSSGQVFPASATSNALTFNNNQVDTHNAFNGSTGIFTAPISGKYEFILNLEAYNTTTNGYFSVLAISNNGFGIQNQINFDSANASRPTTLVMSKIFNLTAGQTITFTKSATYSSGSPACYPSVYYNSLCIKRVGN